MVRTVTERQNRRNDTVVAGRDESFGNDSGHGSGDGRIDIEWEVWSVLLGCTEWHDHSDRPQLHTI